MLLRLSDAISSVPFAICCVSKFVQFVSSRNKSLGLVSLLLDLIDRKKSGGRGGMAEVGEGGVLVATGNCLVFGKKFCLSGFYFR